MAFWNTVLDAQGDAVPNDKQLLVPVLVDEIAKSDPERICFSFSRSMNVANDFQNMNFRTVSHLPLIAAQVRVRLTVSSLRMQSTKLLTSSIAK